MQMENNLTAMSISMCVANSDLGYLALMVSKVEFLMHSGGIPYIAPTSPPESLVHPVGVTSAQIMEINHQYLWDQKTFNAYSEVSWALCMQAIMAVTQ